MKKRIITIGVLMMSGLVFSQVGIGIRAPHKSALLELKADAGEYRGILIPRIPLKGLDDKSNINKGDVAESLLVFNTSSQNGLTPGFYYWRGASWTRVIDSKDILENVDAFPRNKVMSVLGNELILEDSKGHQVRTPKIDLNIITTITEKDNGKYVYKNEAGVESTIDVTGSVITNIEEILKDVNVKQEIYNTVAAEGKVLKGDNAIEVVGGEKAVLSQTTLSLKDGGVTPKKIEGGESRTLLVTSKTGEVKWVSANDKELEDILKLKETTTVLDISQKGKGIYTYYNEEAVKNNGVGVDIDVNSLSIDTTKPGVYVFKDLSSNNPLATIDVSADVINNIDTILKNANVQNSIYNTVAAQGKAVTPADGSIKIDNGGKAALEAMQISIADKGVIPTKIAPGLNKQLLVTDKNGKVSWVDATDEVIKDAIKLNERVTVLTDNKNGTFTYYNESVVNEKGDIVGVGVTFDANTLRIVERKGPKEKGIYDFYDGLTSLESPLMTISTRAKSIHFDNNTTIIEGDNLQEVIDNIINKIEIAQNKPADLKGEGILINNATVLTGAVLKEALLTIADGAVTSVKLGENAVTTNKLNNATVTPVKIAPGKDKTLLVTKNGKVEWVPASDEVIKDVVATNETVTVIVNNNNGTYSYYNEKGIDAKGNIIAGKGQLIDANTLSISDDTKGKYIFSDGNGEIATIDIQATVINNIDSILEHTDVQNSIYTTVAAKGKKLTGDKAIKVSGDGKEVLSATALSLNDGGVEVKKLEKGADKTFLVTTKSGEVKWIGANDSELEEILKLKETNTVLVPKGKGIYTYFNEEAVKNNATGVDIDVNSLSINDDKPGVYEFRDLSSDTPLAIIDIPKNVIENITTILDNTDVQNNIYNTVAAKGKAVTSPKNSIAVAGQGDKAVLNALELEIATGGVQTAHIAPNAVTPAKLEAGNKKGQLLVTNANGEAQWIDANDDIIKEVLKGNQALTFIKDEGNGTFTYYNEECFDKDGVFIEGSKGTSFDANTLYIKNEKEGQYVFFDKNDANTPLAIIDIQKTVIENISEILNDVNVKNEIYNTVAAQGKELTSTDKSIDIKSGNKAVLEDMNLSIAIDGVKTANIQNNAVTTEKIKDTSVTVAKINPEKAVLGTVLTTTSGGTVAFKTPKDVISPAVKGRLIGEKDVIHVTNAPNVLFGDKDVTISINEGGISSKHIRNETIVNEDIAPQTIQASRLDATNETAGHVATVNADGTVSYQALSATAITNKGNITVKDGISVSDGADKVFADVILGLTDGKVAPAKLTPGTDKYLLATKEGKVQWIPATDAIIDDAVKNNETVTILKNQGKGIFTYYNEKEIDEKGEPKGAGVSFDVNSLTIDDSKPEVYVFKDLSDNNPLATIDIAKDVINSIVTILGDTNVKQEIYNIVASQGKAITSTDGSLDIPVNQAGLAGLNMGIALSGVKGTHIAVGAVDATKLSADGTLAGHVATVNADGTVSYKSLISTEVATNAAALKTDGIILVEGASQQGGTLFKETTLSIKEKGINTAQLADNAVTNGQIEAGAVTVDKISAGVDDKRRVMVTDDNGVVKWGELDDIVTDAAGNLTSSDNIIDIKGTSGPVVEYGQNALFKDVVLSINDNSITKDKLSSVKPTGGNEVDDLLLTTDGNGGFKFIPKAIVATPTGDLTSSNTIAITEGNDAVLKDVTIEVKDGAITTAKMSSKVGTVNVGENSVLTAKGDGTVEYKKLNSTVFEGAEANLLSDGSLTIPADNKAVLKETTIGIADDGVKTKHIDNNAVTTVKIASEQVTAEKIKGGAPKQLLITNDGAKAEWVDASNLIIKEIVNSNETITLLTDKGNGTFTYQNEKDIKEGRAGVLFDANTLKIDKSKPGIYVFTDGKGELATINVSEDVINSITNILGDTNVQNKIYEIVSNLGKTVSTDQAIAVTGGEKAVLHPMIISLNDGGVTTKKITSKVDGNSSDKGTVLTADGEGNVIFQKLNEVATTQGKAITSTSKSLAIAGNKAALQDVNIDVANEGIKTGHIAAKAVTVDKIGTNEPAGKLMTTNGKGGVEFKSLSDAIDQAGQNIEGDDAILVTGGEQAALKEVSITLVDGGVSEAKLAPNAVTTTKISNAAVTTEKIVPGANSTLLGTDKNGTVKWLDIKDELLNLIIESNESVTYLHDNNDGTFTYFNEKEVDKTGMPKPGAKGITFDANTLTISNDDPGVFVFKDKLNGGRVIGTIDIRASKIIFQDGDIIYNNVEEAITNIINKIEDLEQGEIPKAAISGKGILVNGVDSQADAVLKAVELTIADNAITTDKIVAENVTTAKIKGGVAKQLLVTNKGGKTEWVDATDEIIKDVVNKNETVTVLTDLGNGKFTYQNEADIKAGNKGVTFDANTLRIEVVGKGKYEFYDKSTTDALAVIDVKADVIENILEIVNEVSVKEEIFNVVAAQGKKVSGDNAIAISAGGEKAALSEMTISLKDSGVTSDKIKKQAVTEDKLYAGENKVNYVPVVQGDGSVKYQPMTSVVTGEMLTVDNSLAVDGDASKALLQALGLKVNEGGIVNTHIQPLAVTTDKISSTLGAVTAKENDILMADGSGNTKFSSPTTVIESAMQASLVGDEAIAVNGGVTNVLFGNENAKLTLVAGGVKGKHIASETIKNGNIANNTIEAEKLTAGAGALNRVAMADDKGVVTYQSLSTNVLTGKGTIKTDEVLAVDNGVDKVLADVTLSVKNNSIKATKFDADGAAAGSVPMVSADGKAVTYQPLNASSINNKGNITTDTALTVSDNGKEKVLSNVTIGVKPQGITTDKIADNAVTNIQVADLAITANKISAKDVGEKRVMISQKDGSVKWGELGDIVTNTAGNLELDNDNILKFDKGTGVNALLADVKLGVNDNSITKEKLSSKVGGKPAGKDKILVSNDAGGFDLVDQTAVQVGGKDLSIGNSLTFTKGDGLNTVLVETGIDVKEQGISTEKLKDEAVTVAKMSSGAATANSVLTAKGGGKVAYEPLSETAFAGKGANFLTDGSIAVLTDNQALLKETKIAIAKDGVQTSHIADKQVTAAKINSEKAANGTVLMADSKGNATFQSLDEVAKAQGKAVKSTDGSIAVTDKNKAALQDLTINIATGGVKNTHIAAQQVTADKIGAPETGVGLVLTTDGQGAAKFESLGDAVAANGKALIGGTGIDVVGTGVAKALLQDATINISDGGVSAQQLAANAVETAKIKDGAITNAKIKDGEISYTKIKDSAIRSNHIYNSNILTDHLRSKAVTTDKISSTVGTVNSSKGQVLTADGSGGAKFETIEIPTVTKGTLTGAGPISVSNGSEAVLKDVALDIKSKSITGGHIADKTIVNGNITDRTITSIKIAEKTIGHMELAPSSVRTEKIMNLNVTTEKVADQAVTDVKIGSGAAQNGEVLTANGSGGATWKKATGGPSFFYAPTFHVKVVPGATNQELDVYQKYVDQFSGLGVVKSDSKKSLHVYGKEDLDYFVVYYDTDVFTNVSINKDGVLKYSVKTGANVTAASYFNVVFQLN